jgi:putative nucleotidyltransferase with HDIG domain
LLRKIAFPARIPILYLILGVLMLVSVVPMYFYAGQVIDASRERLKRNEMLLQNTITASLAEEVSQHQANLIASLSNLAAAVRVTSGGDLRNQRVNTPELRDLLEKFVSSSPDIAYVSLVNDQARGINVGRVRPDDFLQREFERAFSAGLEARAYTGSAMTVGSGKETRTVFVVGQPLRAGDQFLGMITVAVDLEFLIQRLQSVSEGGLTAYVVDREGRVVASATPRYVTGRDMTQFEIVRNFVATAGKARLRETKDFSITEGGQVTDMVGTYSPVAALDWAVMAQKPQRQAYSEVFEMQRMARTLALLAVLMSVCISVLAARRITGPLEVLTRSSRAIAQGDFSQRVRLSSRTEIGELANTFNRMSEDLERFVLDLKRAAEENRALFMGSIQMLAGAVDEKDPYTRGHSDRVTRYSALLAKEMGLSEEQIEVVRVSAQLHDVGKIGIEDRVLKKPGALTPEEYEIMKTHTTRGANILRPVEQLREMIPGIELHHESLDGRGYPYGLKGDQIPQTARIISVADTFDAITTNRPYQAAQEPAYAFKIIRSLAATKFDTRVVDALERVLERGELHLRRAAVMPAEAVAAMADTAVTEIRS